MDKKEKHKIIIFAREAFTKFYEQNNHFCRKAILNQVKNIQKSYIYK